MTYDERRMKIYRWWLSNLFSEYDAWSCMHPCCTCTIAIPMTLGWNTWSAFRTITPSNTNVLIRTRIVANTLFARRGNDLSLFCLLTASKTVACMLFFRRKLPTLPYGKKNVSCIRKHLPVYASLCNTRLDKYVSTKNIFIDQHICIYCPAITWIKKISSIEKKKNFIVKILF